MTNQINHIVEHLFHKKRLDDVSIYEIERFIATHPYFAAGHFLLAKKTQLTEPKQTHDKVATTLLYYNNPLWLQWLLDQDITSFVQKPGEKETAATQEEVTEQYQGENTSDNYHQLEELTTHSKENGEGDKSSIFSDEVPQEDQFGSDKEIIGEPVPAAQQEIVDDHHDDFAGATSSEPPVTISEHESPSGFESPQATINTLEPVIIEEHLQPGNSADTFSTIPADIPETADQTLTLGTTSEDQADDVHDQLQETKQGPDLHQPGQPTVEEEESRATAASIGRTLTTAALIPTRAEIEKGDFTFEPYHTIDYFASQGIKLQQSDLSRDKFGKQLKSFTEWLKSMKRLPQAVAEANMDEATQQSIQRIAEHSFEEKDIVTETMAEVWIKQGNKEKAIDTLHKLSLLNPSKSHYFAAKIEQLKAS